MGGMSHPANWYPDPFGRFELRYFDGANWTEHVNNGGTAAVDPPTPGPGTAVPVGDQRADQVQRQVQQQAGVAGAWQGGGTIFTEPVLVVNQKAKIIEINNEYAIYDQHGRQLGAVRQVGQSAAKKALRVLTSMDQYMTHKLQLVDIQGNVLLALTRPAKVMKSKIIVTNGAGAEVGTIVQENMIGKIRFGLMVGGQRVGSINAENWRAWNFSIRDAQEQEVARITKTWEGLVKTMFTSADNYVIQIHFQLPEPLLSLVVASAVSVDTALKQDQRGFN